MANYLTETQHAVAFLISEGPGTRSREQVTIAQNLTLTAGMVVGRVRGTVAAPVAFAALTDGQANTGNGTFGATPVAIANAQEGVYTVIFRAATKFDLLDPKGRVVGTGTTGTAFAVQLGFTLNAGGTAFVVGDGFRITVAAGTQYAQLSHGGTDGSEIARGVLLADVTSPASATAQGVIFARSAELNLAELVWPASISAGEKTAAIAALADAGIILR